MECKGRRKELGCLSWSCLNVLSAGGRIFVLRGGKDANAKKIIKRKIKKIEMGNGKRPITNRFIMD